MSPTMQEESKRPAFRDTCKENKVLEHMQKNTLSQSLIDDQCDGINRMDAAGEKYALKRKISAETRSRLPAIFFGRNNCTYQTLLEQGISRGKSSNYDRNTNEYSEAPASSQSLIRSSVYNARVHIRAND
ncbi:hypothetical protein KIN20_035676 [Parelaphostrongylus tenuis]|uniref:Uncharacterized protein n=1 Tax=Parelaphostrongylus tenuis TaxID=148309 RepID=A0AAD5WKQ8_PARTN|nr:hypothetical protein KIN20_035676 [Parelaphostrongylus tenuis]